MNAAIDLPTSDNLDTAAEALQECFNQAARTLPVGAKAARQPWTSQKTLDLIEERNMYRRNGDYQSEKILNKQVRSSGKKDRADWLEKHVFFLEIGAQFDINGNLGQ